VFLYNTQTRKKEEFVPIIKNRLSLYACGPTVYDYFHIGNARAFIFFDVVRRYFEFKGYEVNYVQNITDIDDKIINKSIEEKVDFTTVADKYSQAFLDDAKALGIKAPSVQPRATEVMPDIIAYIDALVKSGHAYEANRDVYFDTSSLPSYGSLSGKKTEDQLTGARVAENLFKRNPTDFTLWKNSKPGEPVWQSPWGEGRPGWHTECVVMSQKYLGETFDIHGGGIDLIFPHHENELAQAQALSGKPLANYWLHNGFLNIEGEKMSKSLKNFFTARDILQEYDAEVIRFFFLSKHYRSPIDFTRELMEESKRALSNFYEALKTVDFLEIPKILLDTSQSTEVRDFTSAMDDDFNTAKAIAIMFDLVKQLKSPSASEDDKHKAAKVMFYIGRVLGFFQNLETKLHKKQPDLSDALMELIINYRNEARNNKDWKTSDRIRDDLAALSIEIKDTPKGCIWTQKEQ